MCIRDRLKGGPDRGSIFFSLSPKPSTSDSGMCILPEIEKPTTFSLDKTCTKVVEYEAHSDAGLESDESINGCFNTREPSELSLIHI